jgi:tRNA(His) guanylyltransferase
LPHQQFGMTHAFMHANGTFQYNTCFHALINHDRPDKMTKQQAQAWLKTTNSAEKNELLFSRFGINYNDLDPSFRKGSVVYRRLKHVEVLNTILDEGAKTKKKGKTELTVEHCDIIGDEFWKNVGRDLFSSSQKGKKNEEESESEEEH